MPDIRLDDPIVLTLRHAVAGDYEILAELGRGGMAVVYLAHDLALDRKVAIKVMFPSLLSGEGSAERFNREARTAASLTHPGIIPIYAVRHQGSLLFFVMQFVKGRPLDSVLSEEGRLPLPMVQTIVHQVGHALDYAHRHGVIHRDIKPANILLDDEGRVVVTDFGIAKVATSDSLTQTGGVVGTPSYMSPEQSTADPVTGASDQYSLGTVAYEMLTGRLPIVADNPMQMMYLRVMQDPPPISSLRPDIPPEIESAVHRMLARDPMHRWPDLAHAIAAIGAPSAHEGEETRRTIAQLGRTGFAHRISTEWRTPTSPVPVSRFPGRPATGPAAARKLRSHVIEGTLAAIVLGGAAIWAGLTIAGDDSSPADPVPRTMTPTPPPAEPVATSITLNPASLVLRPGETKTLAAAVLDSAGEALGVPVSWTTGDPAIVRVSENGLVTGRREGVTTVTGRAGSAMASVGVAVRAPPEPAVVTRPPTPVDTPMNKPELPAETPVQSPVPSPVQKAATPRPVPVEPETPAKPTAAEYAAEIGQILTVFADAVESRDMARLRRAYPGMTGPEQQAYGDLFRSNTRFDLRMTSGPPAIAGETATVAGTALYHYHEPRDIQQSFGYTAILERSPTGWQLRSITFTQLP